MRERFADHLADSEHRIEAALQDAVGTLSLVAEAVCAPSGEAIEAIIAAASGCAARAAVAMLPL